MRRVLASLYNHPSDLNSELERLHKYATEIHDADNFPEGPAILFCIEAYGRVSRYPSRDTINREFPDLKLARDEEVGDVDILLYRLIERQQNMALRIRVMKASEVTDRPDYIQTVRDTLAEFDGDGSGKYVSGLISNLDAVAMYEEITSRPPGIRTGVGALDDVLHRIPPGRVATIGAFTGHFKTAFAVSMMVLNARDGFNQCYMSVEMPKDELYQRMVSRHSAGMGLRAVPIPYHNIISAQLTEKQAAALGPVDKDLKAQPGKSALMDSSDLIDLGAGYNFLDGLERAIAKADDEMEGQLQVVYFDHIQYAKHYMNGRQWRGDLEKGNAVVAKLNDLAINFRGRQLIIVMLSQFNREAYNKARRKKGYYTLSSFAEVNEIERASSYALSLFCDGQLRDEDTLLWQLLKHRGGQVVEEPQETGVDPTTGLIGGTGDTQTFTTDSLVREVTNIRLDDEDDAGAVDMSVLWEDEDPNG